MGTKIFALGFSPEMQLSLPLACVGDMELVGLTSNIAEARSSLQRSKADVFLVELKNPSNGIFELIEYAIFLDKKPLIAVIGASEGDGAFARAKRAGADLAFQSPLEFDRIFSSIQEHLNRQNQTAESLNVSLVGDRALDERLASIFIASGIPPHIKGYQFLREAVKQAIKTPSMINNITKQLYPAVALKFNTTPSKVERAIRHAIEVAWQRGKIENINTIYGIKVFMKGEKPTNGELIALISDKLIIERS